MKKVYTKRVYTKQVSMKLVSIVGLGYIGLPTALVAANNGYLVSGFDIDTHKIKSLNNGLCPIIEPGLQELLQITIEQKTFSCSTTLQKADCFIIAVPTPFKEEKKADLSYVFDAAKTIGKKLQKGNLVLLESTVPVGTTEKLTNLLEEHSKLQAKKDFYVAHCPERVLPGKIIQELITNNRIIGGICDISTKLSEQFYKQFVKGQCYLTDDKTAEMVKLIENSSRDVQIAFANQIAAMCKHAYINPFEVIELANQHPRVNILQPGCGVGGHCIAVDPWFLIEQFSEQTKLLKTARQINDQKPMAVIEEVIEQAKRFFKKHNHKPIVVVLGLTFKPDVDDLRESPALQIAKTLLFHTEILELTVCEPFVEKEQLTKLGFTNITTFNKGLLKADILLVLQKHTSFKKVDQNNIMNKIIIDPCGLYEIVSSKKPDQLAARPEGPSKLQRNRASRRITPQERRQEKVT